MRETVFFIRPSTETDAILRRKEAKPPRPEEPVLFCGRGGPLPCTSHQDIMETDAGAREKLPRPGRPGREARKIVQEVFPHEAYLSAQKASALFVKKKGPSRDTII